MAFQVPTHVPRRRTSYSTPQPPALEIPSAPEQPDDDTTHWVLFSPTARTHTTSTDHTRTVGASRLSDFGSFAATQSAYDVEGEADRGDALEDQLDEEGTELDSLDDGLHDFRAPELAPNSPTRLDQGPSAMLPAHDGLGSFQASSQAVQDQLWRHEQYNPQRPSYGHRRHSSVQRHLDTVEEDEATVERARWQRIEQWRLDQSRALLQELEKETRQRRASLTSRSSVPRSVNHTPQPSIAEVLSRGDSLPEEPSEDEDTFWRRITRKVIRDLIGIDDSLLSVIFGESLPLDAQPREQEEPLDMETVLAREPEPDFSDSSDWQTKVLQKIAHELGILVHQLCEHPGAFTTYYQMTKDISSEYAGMSLNRLAESGISQKPAESAPPTPNTTSESMPSMHFMPTIHDSNREHEAQWGIEDDDPKGSDSISEATRLQQESEYWERGLDVMMVFRYLRTRFSRRGYMHTDTHTPSPSRRPQDASRRAAIIRQHHPLVARAHTRSQTQPRRASQFSGVTSPVGIASPLLRPHLRRPSSSCASQSAKLSALSSRRTMTGSSRNYWDIGGSESNSAIGVGAGLGTWGEV